MLVGNYKDQRSLRVQHNNIVTIKQIFLFSPAYFNMLISTKWMAL